MQYKLQFLECNQYWGRWGFVEEDCCIALIKSVSRALLLYSTWREQFPFSYTCRIWLQHQQGRGRLQAAWNFSSAAFCSCVSPWGTCSLLPFQEEQTNACLHAAEHSWKLRVWSDDQLLWLAFWSCLGAGGRTCLGTWLICSLPSSLLGITPNKIRGLPGPVRTTLQFHPVWLFCKQVYFLCSCRAAVRVLGNRWKDLIQSTPALTVES